MRLALVPALLLTMIAPGLAQAGLRICNDTDGGFRLAIGYEGEGGWTSEGWWTVEAGTCAMTLGDALVKSFYYWRAEPVQGAFAEGKYGFCTGLSPFTIVGDTECETRGYQAQNFHEIKLTAGTTRHTLALGRDDLDGGAPGPRAIPDP